MCERPSVSYVGAGPATGTDTETDTETHTAFGDGAAPDSGRDARSRVRGWACPMCSTEIAHRRRPGRRRVYCANACRQRAYRLRQRLRRSVPWEVRTNDDESAPHRAASRDRTHALWRRADPIAGRRDDRGRAVTACGTFARAAGESSRHTRFYATSHPAGFDDHTCRRCVELLGVRRRSIAEVMRDLGLGEASVSPGAT